MVSESKRVEIERTRLEMERTKADIESMKQHTYYTIALTRLTNAQAQKLELANKARR